MSEENIENITKSDGPFPPIFVHHHVLSDINFNGHCLINNNISIYKRVLIIYLYNIYMFIYIYIYIYIYIFIYIYIYIYIYFILIQWARDLNTDFH